MNGKERILEKMGLRIKKARLRRNIGAEVLKVLELERDLELIAVDAAGANGII